MAIRDVTLKQLLPLSLTTTPAVSIRQENKVWVATAMLVHYLESFTDSLVVTDDKNKPIGVIGGYEIIKNIFDENSSDLFDKKTVSDIMDEDLVLVNPETVLKEILEKWNDTRRAFCIIPNQYGGYSAISSRKLLEVAMNCKTDITMSDLPKKNIVTFSSNSSIGHIINSMVENKTRKIMFEDKSSFISDRMIIETIARDLNYLRNTENFLDMKCNSGFKLSEIKKISENLNLSNLSKLMYGMMHPYVMNNDQVFTPWDICLALSSDNVEMMKN